MDAAEDKPWAMILERDAHWDTIGTSGSEIAPQCESLRSKLGSRMCM